jgi:hypothetical protein
MREVLTLLSGIAWTTVYVACIVLGFRQRTYCMPAAALALNFSWECVYAIHGLTAPASLQTAVDVVWAVADAVIVVTFIRFGRAELPGAPSRPRFAVWVVVLMAFAFVAQLLVVQEFGWHMGARFSAFLMNVTMSLLFLAFHAARGGVRGQSVLIAVSKGLGTLAATGVFGVLEHSAFVLGIGIACAVFDALYVAVLVIDRHPTVPRPTERSRDVLQRSRDVLQLEQEGI